MLNPASVLACTVDVMLPSVLLLVVPPLARHIQSTRVKLDDQSFVLNSRVVAVGGLNQFAVASAFALLVLKYCVVPSAIPLEVSTKK